MLQRWAAPQLTCLLFVLLSLSARGFSQEPPYFVTYSDVLEEPGNLEIASQNIYSTPKDLNPFYGQTVELEYGVTGWWTTEVYLQGQVTAHDSTVFTGFRFENRFRPLRKSHWINPVLYLEYEDINQADKSFLEITGNQVIQDKQVSNALLRADVERSIEGKLILSSYWKGVNFSENFIAEKNVSNEPWEFGYAAGSEPVAGEWGQSQGVPVLPSVLCCGRRGVWGAGDAIHLWHDGNLDLCGSYVRLQRTAQPYDCGRPGVWAE